MSSSTESGQSCLPEVPSQPYQPMSGFVFPKRTFGKKVVVRRSCQSHWFEKWKWLHYSTKDDVVFCHVCVVALQSKKIKWQKGDPSFVSKGFSTWKKATVAFKSHESSSCHREAMQMIVELPKTCPDVGDMLSREHATEKGQNRECLLKIISNLKFLARQGLPVRGDGDETDSNFIQLLKLRGQDDPLLECWLSRKSSKYVSHDMQNKFIKIMALSILREIAECIQKSTFFSIMCDECTDSSNREQLVLCICWIDHGNLEPQEDVIGIYQIDDISAHTTVSVIRDMLVRMNFSLSRCRGQCYDGAANMKGGNTGVAKQLLDEELRALYTHCYRHALNLAVGDAVKHCKVMKDALDTTYEVSKLVKYSPKRDTALKKLKGKSCTRHPWFPHIVSNKVDGQGRLFEVSN